MDHVTSFAGIAKLKKKGAKQVPKKLGHSASIREAPFLWKYGGAKSIAAKEFADFTKNLHE